MPIDPYGNYIRGYTGVKPKCKYKVGQQVYLVSCKQTRNYFRSIPYTNLGKKYTISTIQVYNHRGDCKVHLKPEEGGPNIVAHQDDLSFKNTFVDVWKTAPQWLLDVPNVRASGAGYRCHYIVFKHKPNAWWYKLPLDEAYEAMRVSKITRPSDPCPACWEHPCSYKRECYRIRTYKSAKKDWDNRGEQHEVNCAVNDNTACWASFHRLVKNSSPRYDRIFIKLRWEDIDLPKSDPKSFDFEDFCNYIKYMVKGKCLPSYVPIPTMKDWGKDYHCIIRFNKIGTNRLFWYLNTLRNPCEIPMIAALTCHFVEKAKMEPLMALVMGHVCNPNFHGGHAVMDCPDWGRDYANSDNMRIYPNMKEVIRYTIKAHKLLTQKTETAIGDMKTYNRWYLSQTTERQSIRFKSENLPVDKSSSFNVKSREYRR